MRAAIEAGRHVYCEKPMTEDLDAALALARLADAGRRQARRRAGQAVPARHPHAQAGARQRRARARAVACAASSATGSSPVRTRRRSGRRGTTARRTAAASSPTCSPTGATCSTSCSAPVRGVFALGATHIPVRHDEHGRAVRRHRRGRRLRDVRAGRRRRSRSSTRPGACGSTAASCSSCRSTAPRAPRSPACASAACSRGAATPRAIWNPDLPDPIDHRAAWMPVPAEEPDNAFKVQWERFLRHVALDEPFPWDFRAGARGRAAVRARPAARGASGAGSRCRSCDARPTAAQRCGCRAPAARWSRTRPASRGRSPRRAQPADVARRVRRRARRRRPARASPAPGGSTGRRRSPSAGTCGRTAWASPRRWTPRSAAWGSTGRPRAS